MLLQSRFEATPELAARSRGATMEAAGQKYAGLLSVNLDWDRLQALLASLESRLDGAATKDSLNAVS